MEGTERKEGVAEADGEKLERAAEPDVSGDGVLRKKLKSLVLAGEGRHHSDAGMTKWSTEDWDGTLKMIEDWKGEEVKNVVVDDVTDVSEWPSLEKAGDGWIWRHKRVELRLRRTW
jgi:hypothetical protein